jgi:hypothetical protein
MHSQAVRLVALDQVLWFFLRGMNLVAFERDFGGMLFPDRPPDPACFRVPFNVVSCFKIVCYWRNLPLL